MVSIFTWWHGPGIGTLLSGRGGTEVGRDALGNRYFTGKPGPDGQPRRYVRYAGEPEASRVPPEWYLWLHKTVDTPPEATPQARAWEKPWTPNATGTPAAHMPSGSLASAGTRARAIGDYEAWTPE